MASQFVHSLLVWGFLCLAKGLPERPVRPAIVSPSRRRAMNRKRSLTREHLAADYVN
jgi:hypothetical protein